MLLYTFYLKKETFRGSFWCSNIAVVMPPAGNTYFYCAAYKDYVTCYADLRSKQFITRFPSKYYVELFSLFFIIGRYIKMNDNIKCS